MNHAIYILLPVHNRCAVTERFIRCLAEQSYRSYQLVLIDDGSTDGTAEMVTRYIPSATVLRGTGDWWWAGSLQQGIDWLKQQEVADRDIVMFANDDITFDADFLQKAVNILGGLEESLLLPQVIDGETGQPQESGIEANLYKLTFQTAPSPEKINCLPTRGLFMRMADLRRIGGFYPRLLPHYLSDYEFTIRAKRKGIKLLTDSALNIRFDLEQTGFRDLENLTCWDLIKRSFSKRYVSNPIYWSMFILLTVPNRNIPSCLFRFWKKFIKTILKHSTKTVRKRHEKGGV